MKKTIFLVRHGETEWSRRGRLTSRTNLPLTDLGKAEALQVGGLLRELLARVQKDIYVEPVVLSSPLLRARTTAEVASLSAPIRLCDELREADFGEYEGLTTSEIRDRAPGWRYWQDGCVGGEGLADLRIRLKVVEESVRRIEHTVIVFGHGVAHRVLACMLAGLPLETGDSIVLDTGAVILVQEGDDSRHRIHLFRMPIT